MAYATASFARQSVSMVHPPILPGASEATRRRLDPTGCLARALAEEAPPRGRAEEVLLAWLIALPDGLDPAEAARALADCKPAHGLPAETLRLFELIEQVARYPAAALSRRRARG